MSEMERNKGCLIPSTLEDALREFPDASREELEWDTDGKYVNIGEGIYRVEWEAYGDIGLTEFSEVKPNWDGSLSFHTYHYNGGAHWTDLLEEKILKEDKNG